MHSRAAAFRAAARDVHGFDPDVREFPEGTKTAADAAAAIGCDIAQIASSIAVDVGGDLAIVVTSGENRVDTASVASALGASDATLADADEVKATLGWAIGGVPPFCHETTVPVLVDDTLLTFDEVWAAAGTPRAVFPVDPERLLALSDGRTADVVED